ncbi:MAG TPA: hypothetical protein VFV67_36375 [Actinophytocola sp.]|uniref:hypothetical protein n=1 Tax=Actinophytocola sp. TaxID=1872138 RepID=UPI002DBC86EE|nr:hypothetical protein [Actinophytocola sp.]HEU5476135.1 hypothetical protein [Actinophytocola sp.]
MGFSVTCTPGRQAAAAFMKVSPELPALVMYLDPVNMAIQLPPFPDGPSVLARFCRELAREAGRLADKLESGKSDG